MNPAKHQSNWSVIARIQPIGRELVRRMLLRGRSAYASALTALSKVSAKGVRLLMTDGGYTVLTTYSLSH